VLILYRLDPVGRIPAKSFLLWGAAIAVAVAIAGCGGGSSSSGSTAAAGGETTSATNESSGKSAQGKGESSADKSVQSGDLSKAEFVKRANAICEEGKKQSLEKMAAFVKEHKGDSGQPSAELVVKAVQAVFIPQVQTQIDEIRALGSPQGDEATVEAFLDAMEEGATAASEASTSSTASFGQSFKRSAELAHEYGLDGCAYG
jgi:hypothetical protein